MGPFGMPGQETEFCVDECLIVFLSRVIDQASHTLRARAFYSEWIGEENSNFGSQHLWFFPASVTLRSPVLSVTKFKVPTPQHFDGLVLLQPVGDSGHPAVLYWAELVV